VGSLVNTFVPARAGDAVRLGLFSRLVPSEHPMWTAGGAFAALGVIRAPVLGLLVLIGAVLGAVPLWPLCVAGGLAALGVVLAVRAWKSHAHLLDAFRTLGPAAGLRIAAWIALSIVGRLLAATAVGAALGIPRPYVAALIIVPALDVSGIVPLTPGNLGIASAAIAFAFRAHGVPFSEGLAAGISFQAIETAVGVSIGTASLLWLTPFSSPRVRRLALGSAGFAALLGAGVLASLS
jgi:hypothetical protein